MLDRPSRAPGDRWTIITVTFNSAAVLRRCWAAADLGAARWLVVDNASSDDSVTVARELGGEVLQGSRNSGFSVANNAGLGLVDSEWVAFVNPDVTIGSGSDLDRLARVSGANDALVAPQLLNPDGSEQPNARGLPYIAAKLANRGLAVPGVDSHEYARAGFSAPTYAAWAMGAAYAGPTALFRELGGWDERYFIYYEDHDLGLRSWRSGHPVVVDPRTRWVHEWQRATTRLDLNAWRHELRSARIFYSTFGLRLRRGDTRDKKAFQKLHRALWTAARDAHEGDAGVPQAGD